MIVRIPMAVKPYDVHVERGVLARLPSLLPEKPNAVAIVGDRRLAAISAKLERSFERAGIRAITISVRADEALKSLAAIEPLYGRLLRAGIDRNAAIVAVGGGTIGDAVGFLAATYLRGLPLVQVPTTLLAAVDSAIGGKTGVNHALGKNLIGVIRQPAVVAIDTECFGTLGKRDRVSGLGEIVKYGLIADAKLYGRLHDGWNELLELDDELDAVIARCAAIKAGYVARDEDDRGGFREQLNFGHTVAHAVERVAGYGAFRHGEAVILGMRAATRLSALRGHCTARVAGDVDAFLAELPVPRTWRKLDAAAITAATRTDKKRGRGGATRFVVLNRIGRTGADDGIGEPDVRATLRELGFA